MGCINAKEGGGGADGGAGGGASSNHNAPSSKRGHGGVAGGQGAAPQPAVDIPQYITADLDLGWRNISESSGRYPLHGFTCDFQNERSGNVLKRLDLCALAINIGCRANNLADRYGLVEEGGIRSSANLLESLAKMQEHADGRAAEEDWQQDVTKDMNKILKYLGCPRFGWRLVSRASETAPIIRKNPQIFLHGEYAPDATALAELSCIPDYLQCLTNAEGKSCLLDVGEIGLNIAEQLFRLEKSEAVGCRVPQELFGWKILLDASSLQHQVNPVGPCQDRSAFAIPVATADGEALMMIPEEVIMNVASWVQQTYLTAPAF